MMNINFKLEPSSYLLRTIPKIPRKEEENWKYVQLPLFSDN